MAYINQHSYTIGATFLLLLTSALILRRGLQPLRLLAVAGLAVGLLVYYSTVRPNDRVESDLGAVDAAIGSGQHVLLEFLSPY